MADSHHYALNADYNLRCFASDSAASMAAGSRRFPHPAEAELGPLNLLIEALPEPAASVLASAAAGAPVACCVSEVGAWLSGTSPHLEAVADALHSHTPDLTGEMRAALQGYLAARRASRSTLVMGILNVTPDSFSDGGLWLDTEAAVEQGLRLVEEGADVLDIGGESTRPGAAEIPAEEELRRVLPVVERLREQTSVPLSIDTRKAAVAERCLEAGANWVNDISGLTYEPELAAVVARYPGTELVLMHSRSRPGDERYSTEYDSAGRPVYTDVVADTLRWLRRQVRQAVAAGVPAERIWIDPGFGFGKTYEQNVELLRRLPEYNSLGLPVLLGTSRKSSVGRMLGDLPPGERLEGTLATSAWAAGHGAAAVRVHDVQANKRVVTVIDALR